MERYVVQTHIHGSASEGPGSYGAHDLAAAQAGHVDLIWWMDHDWRLANFAKMHSFGFDADEEILNIPNRDPQAEPATTPIVMKWEPVEGNDPNGSHSVQTELAHAGAGSYRLQMPAGDGQRSFALELNVQVYHARFPLFSHPQIRFAVYVGDDLSEGCHPFIRLQLSQQPPDLEPASIIYIIGKNGAPSLEGKRLEIPLPAQCGGWMELTLDPAADVQQYGVPGGLDNALYAIQIGVSSNGPAIAANFDSLQIEPRIKGTECLNILRGLVERSSFATPSLVGIEVSYYGQHVNAFGSSVPIPDYELIPRSDFNTRMIVDHIHQHGGLACLNHPPAGNLAKSLNLLVENLAFDVDLMEIAHGAGGLIDRLLLFDRLAERGFTITGIAASDGHSALAGWGIRGKAPAWVNHIWAKSLSEADLLEALSLGRVYVVDPAEFAGTLTLTGPAGVTMGDVVESAEFPTLACRISGLQPDDIVTWLINGHPAHVAVAERSDYYEEWRPTAPVREVAAVRIQVYRPFLATSAYRGLILASNPIYITNTPLQTRHCVHAL